MNYKDHVSLLRVATSRYNGHPLVRGIDFVCFYKFLIRCCNSSEGMVFLEFLFPILVMVDVPCVSPGGRYVMSDTGDG
jgi:hypothetical protein